MDLLHPGGASRWRGPGPGAPGRWRRLVDPWRFYELARRPVPALLMAAALLWVTGLSLAWAASAADPASLDAERVLALHLPLAWLSLAWACALFAAAVAGRLTTAPLPSLLIEAMAPTAALAALLAVATGALWQHSSGGATPPWRMPVPAAAWPWAAAAAAQSAAAVLVRVRLVIVERARRGLEPGSSS